MAIIGKPPVIAPAVEAGVETASARKTTGRWVLAATILGSSIASIDGTAVNVALPALQEKLGATITDAQWVIEAYTLFLAALILVGGALGDRYGRRRVYALGVALFAVSSVLCGLSQSIYQLIGFRALQGVGGALLIPGSLSIITVFFSPGERGRAIGTWSAFSAITTALGPVLGGWLIENVSWRWIFFINVPIAAAVLAILFLRVPESRRVDTAGRVDWAGGLLATLGLGGILFGLIESSNHGFSSALVIASLALGALALLSFVVVEAREESPMMPPALFRSVTFSGANAATLYMYGALGGVFFFLPFALIQVYGYTATEAGASLLPIILIIFVLSRWAGGLTDKYGARVPFAAGTVVSAAGYLSLALFNGEGSFFTTVFPGISLVGLGLALSIAPLTTAVMNAAEVGYSGTASGINNAVARMAGLLTIAVLGIVILHAFNGYLDAGMDAASLPAHARELIEGERIKMAGAEIPASLDPETAARLGRIVRDSFIGGFDIVLYIAAAMSLLAAGIGFLTIGRKPEASHSSHGKE
jgi:EmrB/QacA subfamily drug resistance transporter